MIIRKLFKFEGAHIVRDCSSDRCKRSCHGHSYVVEIFLKSDQLDNGQMVVDFGLLKGTIKDFIDSFDHAYSMWDRESNDYKTFMKENSERWIEMPVSPSAEMYSLMFYALINAVLDNTVFNNGEKNVKLHSVRVHETDTGYAESFYEDYITLWCRGNRGEYDINQIKFSDQIKKEWKDPEMFDKLLSKIPFVNPIVELKYQK